ncbi:hypothetical protein, partial [Acinetobacter baumannii]|uniref:hypothetical protein n=1 Tax=Acinetobacter baumannii TaxID=470 RepID=UPI00406458EF
MYAVRLDQIRKLPEAQTFLAPMDGPGLLAGTTANQIDVEALDEDALLAELGVENAVAGDNDITKLRHVRPYVEIKAAEEIANRTPCKD